MRGHSVLHWEVRGAPWVEAAALLVGVDEVAKALREVRCETHQGECWLIVWSGEGLQDYIRNVSSYLHCTGVMDSGISVNIARGQLGPAPWGVHGCTLPVVDARGHCSSWSVLYTAHTLTRKNRGELDSIASSLTKYAVHTHAPGVVHTYVARLTPVCASYTDWVNY